MTDTAFDTHTSRFSLPLLYSGQAQKELFVNEMAVRLDCLLHPAIEGVAPAPPPTANEGEAWVVGQAATGDWTGREGQIACRQSGNWIYVIPAPAMRAFDKQAGQTMIYREEWVYPQRPEVPDEGATVDVQARAAIEEIVAALSTYGIFSA